MLPFPTYLPTCLPTVIYLSVIKENVLPTPDITLVDIIPVTGTNNSVDVRTSLSLLRTYIHIHTHSSLSIYLPTYLPTYLHTDPSQLQHHRALRLFGGDGHCGKILGQLFPHLSRTNRYCAFHQPGGGCC